MAIAVELLEPKGFGRVRLARLREVNSETLCAFVGSVVTAGATVRTDGWSVYTPLAKTFGHQSVAISRAGQPAHVALPGVHRVASLFKRWLTGTLHYGYSVDQLDYYVDEFTFRFNRRTARSRGCSSTGSSNRPSSPTRTPTGSSPPPPASITTTSGRRSTPAAVQFSPAGP